MAGVLPEGLLSNKKGVSVATEDVQFQVEDILKLWRSMVPWPAFLFARQLMLSFPVYSSGYAATAENVGRRLANFFWRIAMNDRIRGHLSGAVIDKQFDSISQGGHIGSYDTGARSTASTKGAVSSSPAKARPVHGEEQPGNTSPQGPSDLSLKATTGRNENRRIPIARPPPILKKLSSGSKTSSRSSLVLSPASQGLSSAGASNDEAVTFDDDPTSSKSFVPIAGKSARKSTTTRFNEEVAVSIPKVSIASRLSGGRSSGESSSRTGRKNPILVASSGTSKRRPSIMRQKSSQAPSTGASKDSPLRNSSSPNLARSMKPNHTNIGQSPSQEAEASSSRRSRASSPYPSKHPRLSSTSQPSSEEDVEDFSGDDAGPQEPSTNSNLGHTPVKGLANAASEPSKSLVDPDFRSRFENKNAPPNRSFTNISSFARKSSAVVPTAASFEASGMLDTGQGTLTAARGKDAFNNEIIPLKAPASAGPGPPAEASQPLPRTKSQLTLLLEREKNRSAGKES